MSNSTVILGRVLILGTNIGDINSYLSAAEKLGVASTVATEAGKQPHGLIEISLDTPRATAVLDGSPGEPALHLRFDERESALAIVQYAMEHPLAAIIAADGRSAPACARSASMLGLKWHPPRAADLCADKGALQRKLSAAGLLASTSVPETAGQEFAISAILDFGKLRVLGAIPPFSDLSSMAKRAFEMVLKSAREVNLTHGPLTAKIGIQGEQISILDLNPAIPANDNAGPRFSIPLVDEDISLAEVVMRHALGLDISRIHRKT